ncbi:MAG: FecCD family ABC transporter permease [Anaerolineae bacterium]
MRSQVKHKHNWIILRAGAFSFKLDKRVLPVIGVLLALGALTLVVSVSYGEYAITPLEVLGTLFGMNDDARFELVVWQFRLPRIAVAFLIGAALAVSGTILQGITRNPLADPGILGVTAGASLAAVASIVWLRLPASTLPFSTFAGASIMAGLIYMLAWRGGSSSIRLILVGIGLGAIATALTNLMIVFGDINQVQQAYVWLAGSVYGRDWGHVSAIVPWLLVLIPLATLQARQLNTLNLGDDTARGLGVAVEIQRGVLLLVAVALAGIAVAVSGTVGFVGLVAPHITRRLVGPAHEGLIPASALLGGVLVMFADLISRWVLAPSELPVGIVTAIIGAPYFMYLLYLNRNQ